MTRRARPESRGPAARTGNLAAIGRQWQSRRTRPALGPAESEPADSPAPVRSAGRAWYIVGLLCLLGVMSYMDRLSLSLLIDPIRADLHIDDTRAGLLMGPAFALFYASMALPVAWAIDRGNRRWILAGGVALWSISTSAAAFAPDFETLFVMRMGVGIGEAVLSPATVSLIGDLFTRERRPTPLAAVLAAQTVGGGLSLMIVGAVLGAIGAGTLAVPLFLHDLAPWRVTLFFVGVPGLLVAAALLMTTREPERVSAGDAAAGDGGRDGAFPSRAAAARFFAVFLLGGNLGAATLYVMAMWFPTHLIRAYGIPAATVGFSYGLVALVAGGVGALGLPALAERMAIAGRRDALLTLSIGAIPVALLLLLAACNAPGFASALAVVSVFLVIGTGVGAIPSVVIASLAGSRVRGRLAAVHLLFQAAIPSSLAPFSVGYLSDHVFAGHVGEAITVVGLVCYPLAFLLFLACRRAYARACYGRRPQE